jgi:hypothetical protein
MVLHKKIAPSTRCRRGHLAGLVAALVAAMWAITGTVVAQDGFGRFGRYNDDGLLTLNIQPDRFNFEGMFCNLEVVFANAGVSASVTAIDTTRKTLSLSGSDSVSPNSVRYTLLYPGFSIDYGTKDALTMHLNTDRVAMDQAPASPAPFTHWILIRPSGEDSIPFALAFRRNFLPSSAQLIDEGSTSRLEIIGTDIGEVRVVTPTGITKFYTYNSVQELRNKADAWARRGVPILQNRAYAYNSAVQTVTTTETFTTADGDAIAPVPPVLAFAMSHGYPASIQQTLLTSDCTTKYGPFAYVNGASVTYTLPLPPLDDRGYVRVAGYQTRKNQLNSLVSHLSGSWATNAVDLGYAGMTNAQMAWPYLTTANKNNLLQAWTDYLWEAFMIPVNGEYNPTYTGPKAWKETTEPFTGIKYMWTYKIDGPPPASYPLDIEWGIMLPLYGMYKYAQFTGDWAFVADNWWEVRDHIYKYVDKGEDWAWMTVVNGDMGYSTGTGDPMTAAFCGQLACLKMARALGQTNDEAFFAFKCARAAVPAVSRFWYTDWARNVIYAVYPNSVVLGFYEKRPVVSGEMDESSEDPWPPTTALSGDGILPEMFNAFMAFAKPALKTYETEFEAAYPHWSDAAHSYSFPTTYSGNSVYVTFPHIYLKAQLGDNTQAELWSLVDSAWETTSSAYFVGPNVIAELLSRETPIILTEWRPASYDDGYHDTSSGNKVVLNFTLPTALTTWTLRGKVSDLLAPSDVTVNGLHVGFLFDVATHVLQVTRQAQNAVTVEVLFQSSTTVPDWSCY